MASPEWTLVLQGDYIGALLSAFSNMLPFGLTWIIVGVLIFGVTMNRTKSYAISGLLFIIYSAIVLPAELIAPGAEAFLGILVGVLLAVMIVKVIK